MAAGNTYEAIATQTLGSAQASVTFSSIPSTYTDLILVVSGSSTAGTNGRMRVGNGSVDTGTNYSFTSLDGNGTSALSYRFTNETSYAMQWYSQFSTAPGNVTTEITHIMDYSNTTTYKPIIVRSGLVATGTSAGVGLWRSTAAINTLTYFCANATTFAAGFTASLYGIKAA